MQPLNEVEAARKHSAQQAIRTHLASRLKSKRSSKNINTLYLKSHSLNSDWYLIIQKKKQDMLAFSTKAWHATLIRSCKPSSIWKHSFDWFTRILRVDLKNRHSRTHCKNSSMNCKINRINVRLQVSWRASRGIALVQEYSKTCKNSRVYSLNS